MRGAPGTMTVVRPRTVREALRLYAATPEALPLVGGTDLMVAWNLGELNHRVVLDLSRLDDWSRIERTTTGLRIGALVTHAAVQRHAVVRRRFGLLVAACATVGGVQIQLRGTVCGNIANASPAADTLPPLAVYNARVHTVSAAGRRVLPLLDVFAGPKKTTLRPGELIEAVELPFAARAPSREVFRKVGTRAAQAISKIVAAGLLWLSPKGTIEDARFAVGSLAPTVRRLRQAEAHLIGQQLTPELAREASMMISADVAPIDDMRSTAAYRLAVTERLVEGFLAGAVDGRAARVEAGLEPRNSRRTRA
jgi:CO/xanthine dehydrogenase FAD-binding subunit